MSERPSGQFSRADLDRISAETFVEEIDFHLEIGSTNDRAMDLAGERVSRSPLLVLTELQTAGRGRGANRWWAIQGGLTCSVLFDLETAGLPRGAAPQVSLTAGLAVCEALDDLIAGASLGLKWPNDVFLEGRKVCGILVELPRGRDGALVIGIGINVNNSLREAPLDFRDQATSLRDATGRHFRLVDVLVPVLGCLWERLGWIGSRGEELRRRWRGRCLLTGRTVCVDSGHHQVEGVCRGIDDDGALVVDTASGAERCLAGVVTRFK